MTSTTTTLPNPAETRSVRTPAPYPGLRAEDLELPVQPEVPALDPVQLIEYTRFVAAEVRAGAYPFVEYDADTRWHRRLYRDQRVDLWLISWLPDQGTSLHDHGGSSGAFTVVSGELAEAVFVPGAAAEPGRLHDRTRGAGRSVGFGPSYVHDVRNLSDGPAVSVHAYSRPLTRMTYYELESDGLVAGYTLDTTDPEPQLGDGAQA